VTVTVTVREKDNNIYYHTVTVQDNHEAYSHYIKLPGRMPGNIGHQREILESSLLHLKTKCAIFDDHMPRGPAYL
jgi:hypothetical protein